MEKNISYLLYMYGSTIEVTFWNDSNIQLGSTLTYDTWTQNKADQAYSVVVPNGTTKIKFKAIRINGSSSYYSRLREIKIIN